MRALINLSLLLIAGTGAACVGVDDDPSIEHELIQESAGDPDSSGGLGCPGTIVDQVPADLDRALRDHYVQVGEIEPYIEVDDDGRAVHVSGGVFEDLEPLAQGQQTVITCSGACNDQDCTSYTGCTLSGYTCTACSCGWWCDGCTCTRGVAVVKQAATTSDD